MKKDDELKTSFITPSGTYCYLWMPEGLKNAGGSFNRIVTSQKILTLEFHKSLYKIFELKFGTGIQLETRKQMNKDFIRLVNISWK